MAKKAVKKDMAERSSLSYGLIEKVKQTLDLTSEKLLEKVLELRDTVDETYFEMGGILRKIYDNRLYLDFGYDDWKQFIEEKIGYSLRKAQYLMAIWHYFAVQIGDEETIRKIAPLGWSRAKELIGVVEPSNVDEWIKKCHDKTVTEISKMVTDTLSGGVSHEKAAKLISFKLYEGQYKNVEEAIAIAESLSGSKIKSENLSLIALEYIANNSTEKAKETEKWREEYLQGIEETLGIKIIAIENGSVFYGKKYVEQ